MPGIHWSNRCAFSKFAPPSWHLRQRGCRLASDHDLDLRPRDAEPGVRSRLDRSHSIIPPPTLRPRGPRSRSTPSGERTLAAGREVGESRQSQQLTPQKQSSETAWPPPLSPHHRFTDADRLTKNSQFGFPTGHERNVSNQTS